MITAQCLICDKDIEYKYSKYPKRYCSRSCRNRARVKKGKHISCLNCGKDFYCFPSLIRINTRYCSKKCWTIQQSDFQKGKKVYSDILKRVRNNRDYNDLEMRKRMSQSLKKAYIEGRAKKRIGEANNLWKGGIANLQNRERNKPEYKEWRKAVYERDNYTCQQCGIKSSNELQAHHIKEFGKYPQLRYVVSNGLTVCRACHSEIHGRFIPNIGLVNRRVSVI